MNIRFFETLKPQILGKSLWDNVEISFVDSKSCASVFYGSEKRTAVPCRVVPCVLENLCMLMKSNSVLEYLVLV